jgi:hypothetical protein
MHHAMTRKSALKDQEFFDSSNYLPWLMENHLPLVIASVAKQSPGKQGDCFAACGGSQ